MFDQILLEVNIPSPSFHLAHSISYSHYYIWSSYPESKTAKIDYSALFSFDPPSAILFSFSLLGAVALMKVFTYFGSKLGLNTVSEEPVNIPTRYFVEQGHRKDSRFTVKWKGMDQIWKQYDIALR